MFPTLSSSKQKKDITTIAFYNVENLFDLVENGSDYKEYKPNKKSKWNQKNFNIKINNVLKVTRKGTIIDYSLPLADYSAVAHIKLVCSPVFMSMTGLSLSLKPGISSPGFSCFCNCLIPG